MLWFFFIAACFLPYLMIWVLAHWGGVAFVLIVLALWVAVDVAYGE